MNGEEYTKLKTIYNDILKVREEILVGSN